jgi:hypothetical protein
MMAQKILPIKLEGQVIKRTVNGTNASSNPGSLLLSSHGVARMAHQREDWAWVLRSVLGLE